MNITILVVLNYFTIAVKNLCQPITQGENGHARWQELTTDICVVAQEVYWKLCVLIARGKHN